MPKYRVGDKLLIEFVVANVKTSGLREAVTIRLGDMKGHDTTFEVNSMWDKSVRSVDPAPWVPKAGDKIFCLDDDGKKLCRVILFIDDQSALVEDPIDSHRWNVDRDEFDRIYKLAD